MSLDVLHAGELGHVRRTCAPQHLVRDAIDAGVSAGFLEDTKTEIVRIDRSPAPWWENERLRLRVLGSTSPEFKFRVNRSRKPNEGGAALRLGLDLHAVRDAAVDPQAVALFVVPSKSEHLAGAQEADQLRITRELNPTRKRAGL